MSAADASPEEQLKAVLRFFRSKRDTSLAEVDAIVSDAIAEKLNETMYNQEDVEGILRGLAEELKGSVADALKQAVHMNVLLLRQVLDAADARGVDVELDLATIEDKAMIAEVERLRIDAPPDEASRKRHAAVKLESIADEHTRVVQELHRLRDENATLSDRFRQLQERCTQALREKSELSARLAAGGSESKSDQSVASSAEVAAMRAQLEEARLALREAERAEAAHVSQSKQFQQLRRVVERKNAQLTDLRRRLQQYEPDAESASESDG